MAAKKPQDRLPKKLAVKDVEGGKQVTVDGMKIIVRDAALKDHRVIVKLAQMRKGDLPVSEKIILNAELIDRILGEEQSDMLIEKLADEHGYTDMAVLAGKFNEILGAAYPNS